MNLSWISLSSSVLFLSLTFTSCKSSNSFSDGNGSQESKIPQNGEADYQEIVVGQSQGLLNLTILKEQDVTENYRIARVNRIIRQGSGFSNYILTGDTVNLSIPRNLQIEFDRHYDCVVIESLKKNKENSFPSFHLRKILE